MKFFLIASVLLSGCGMEVHVDPIESKPVQVVHTLNINFDSISNYCTEKCLRQSSDEPTVNSRTADCYTNFIDILSHGLTNVVSSGGTNGI